MCVCGVGWGGVEDTYSLTYRQLTLSQVTWVRLCSPTLLLLNTGLGPWLLFTPPHPLRHLQDSPGAPLALPTGAFPLLAAGSARLVISLPSMQPRFSAANNSPLSVWLELPTLGACYGLLKWRSRWPNRPVVSAPRILILTSLSLGHDLHLWGINGWSRLKSSLLWTPHCHLIVSQTSAHAASVAKCCIVLDISPFHDCHSLWATLQSNPFVPSSFGGQFSPPLRKPTVLSAASEAAQGSSVPGASQQSQKASLIPIHNLCHNYLKTY